MYSGDHKGLFPLSAPPFPREVKGSQKRETALSCNELHKTGLLTALGFQMHVLKTMQPPGAVSASLQDS